MTPELVELERVLSDIFRDISTATRLADMAGLDATKIDKSGSPADVWHTIICMAVQDGALTNIVDRARVERPRNTELTAAWNAYNNNNAMLSHTVYSSRPPSGQAGATLSDYRADDRRDARIDQMQRDLSDMRAQIAALVVQVTALTEMIKMQDRREASSTPQISNMQFAAIILAMFVMALVIFAAVYYGGNR
jgi:hypothetical protein